MSIWYEITDEEDIDFSEDGKEMHILYDNDNTGNYYVSVSVELLKAKLKEIENG